VTVNPALDRLQLAHMKTPIFARARLSGPPLQLGVPSPADLAAAVRKPAAPQAAQAALYELHERRSALLEETRQLSTVIFTEKGADGGRAMRRAAQLGGEIKELDQRIAEATAERRPHLAQVASTLAPLRASAIENAADGLELLLASLALIDAANREILRAGGTVPRFPPIYRNAVGQLRERIRRPQ
jgi:hypothetical protein